MFLRLDQNHLITYRDRQIYPAIGGKWNCLYLQIGKHASNPVGSTLQKGVRHFQSYDLFQHALKYIIRLKTILWLGQL
ncbi:hypothetical protein OP10G_2974 [Fimbriimonas ginsengisoli Gsoil 348]|uniref:Uncharacterized protein n=1 Tax=Fimbriimonas ginsengisoli Gsoil 348 TaxID=661478 RepID=A0A068NSK6_FIMGI|nr:hypothetical protein OP10G_2974 [Fimbriimonas ginsengisoli Gsoil 348]